MHKNMQLKDRMLEAKVFYKINYYFKFNSDFVRFGEKSLIFEDFVPKMAKYANKM